MMLLLCVHTVETVSHSKANERIGEIFQGESEEFRERVRRVGNLVIHLLNDAHSSKNQPLVQTCFLCWRQMMYFPGKPITYLGINHMTMVRYSFVT